MIDSLMRKGRQVADDPTLRRWMIARMTGRTAAHGPFTPHVPPYLNGSLHRAGAAKATSHTFTELDERPPEHPIDLTLPGQRVRLSPDAPERLFDDPYEDLETTLAAHRFAWVPLWPGLAPAAWVNGLWRAWFERHATSTEGWAWHPYTAAERAINILDYARQTGLPGPVDETIDCLATHGRIIADGLEYYGDHYTSNHLSNNARGLFRIGLALGIAEFADLGGRILLAEAGRIFAPSGILREGSSHYHLLLTRNYIDAWLAAHAHDRPETGELERVAQRALAVAPALRLPAGMPLVGDISPDCPPGFLAGLADRAHIDDGWTGRLDPEWQEQITALSDRADPVDEKLLQTDGWWRMDHGPWSGLWHVSPQGWPHMPGHGHQDIGGFELHHGAEALFVDPGRGAYGEQGEAGAYVSARHHNAVLIDGKDPYPRNRPQYCDTFRQSECGSKPQVEEISDGLEVSHDGFSRLRGVANHRRVFSFTGESMKISDFVTGTGRHRLTRLLHTPHQVELSGSEAHIISDHARFLVRAEVPVMTSPSKRWIAYGESVPATTIEISLAATLPVKADLTIEVV